MHCFNAVLKQNKYTEKNRKKNKCCWSRAFCWCWVGPFDAAGLAPADSIFLYIFILFFDKYFKNYTKTYIFFFNLFKITKRGAQGTYFWEENWWEVRNLPRGERYPLRAWRAISALSFLLYFVFILKTFIIFIFSVDFVRVFYICYTRGSLGLNFLCFWRIRL